MIEELTLILFIATQAAIVLFIFMILHAALIARKQVPILAKIFLCIAITTGFLIDFLWARFAIESGWFSPDFIYEYRYIYEVIIGIVGFYFLIDIYIQDPHRQVVSKAIMIGVGTNLITALLLLNLFVPAIRTDPAGFMFLGNVSVPLEIRGFILLTKLFGWGGYVLFLVSVIHLVIKSHFFDRKSSIFLALGLLALIDVQLLGPYLDTIGVSIDFYYLSYLAGIIFIIAARLNRLNIKVMMHVHYLSIIYRDGVSIYSVSDEHVSPDLVGSALSGVSSLIQEITESKTHVQMIDEGDRVLHFAFGNHIFCVIIVDKESVILQRMLSALVKKFEKAYGSVLEHWTGNMEVFRGTEKIVNSIFSITPHAETGVEKE